jgi:hypothetical protein
VENNFYQIVKKVSFMLKLTQTEPASIEALILKKRIPVGREPHQNRSRVPQVSPSEKLDEANRF